MIAKIRNIKAVFSVLSCLAFFAAVSSAVTPEEIKKIEAAAPAKATVRPAKGRKLLVFNLCNGYKHSSIPYWDKALEIMGDKTGAYKTVVSSDMNVFRAENLKQFDAICLNNTTRLDFKDPALRKGFMDFIKGGKGLIGIHAATDNFYEWPEAAGMMGGQFCGHPWVYKGTWAVKIDEPDHPLTAAFKGKGFKVKDEIYRTNAPLYSRDKQRVLMSLDMSDKKTRSVKKFKKSDQDTGISWVKSVGKGRLFYGSLGHNHHITWTPAILQHYLDGIQFAMGDLPVDTAPIPVGTSELSGLLKKIAKYEYGQNRKDLVAIADIVRKEYKSPKALSRIESGFLRFLRSDATLAAKQFICRQLSLVGTEASVGVLGEMLIDPKTSDMARYALERIPGAATCEVLCKALPKTAGKEKTGIIGTLGQCGDERSVPVLAGLVRDRDPEIAVAAASALGRIAGEQAKNELAKLKGSTKGQLHILIMDGYLNCANKMLDQGDKGGAWSIYQQAFSQSEPWMIRVAAMQGMAKVGGEKASKVLIDVLGGDDQRLQAAAVVLVGEMSGARMTEALVGELPRLSPLGQVRILSALERRADKSALPAVTKAVKSDNLDVRVAALAALGAFGDESSVELLAKTAAGTTDREHEAASESLYRLGGAGVDRVIVAEISTAEPAVKIELIRSVAKRGIKGAVKILLKTAVDADSKVRGESLKILGEVAEAKHTGILVDLLAKTQEPNERKVAERTLLSVLSRTKNAEISHVLRAVSSVEDVSVRCSLLWVLGKTGDKKSLPILRQALKGGDAEIKRAAILALSDWPGSEPMGDLLAIARGDTDSSRKVLALRGYIRLVATASKRPAGRTVELLKEAMGLAERVNEKKAVLAVLPGFACKEALQLAQSCVQEKGLAAEAKLAVKKIKKAMAKK